MGQTSVSRNLNKTTAVLLKDGTILEGINYAQFKAGVTPTIKATVVEEEVIPETIEQKRARLQAELDALN